MFCPAGNWTGIPTIGSCHAKYYQYHTTDVRLLQPSHHAITLEVSLCWYFPSLHQCSPLSTLRLTQVRIWSHPPLGSVSHYPFRPSTSPVFGLLPIAHVVKKCSVLGSCSNGSRTGTFAVGSCDVKHLATGLWLLRPFYCTVYVISNSWSVTLFTFQSPRKKSVILANTLLPSCPSFYLKPWTSFTTKDRTIKCHIRPTLIPHSLHPQGNQDYKMFPPRPRTLAGTINNYQISLT